MPMDIRAYFSKTPEAKGSCKKPLDSGNTKTKKSRKRVFVDSDSDEEAAKSKVEEKATSSTKKSTKKSKPDEGEKSKYFEVSKKEVKDFFGKSPVKRIAQPKPKEKPKAKSEEDEIIGEIDWDDDDFNMVTCEESQTQSSGIDADVSPSPKKTKKTLTNTAGCSQSPVKKEQESSKNNSASADISKLTPKKNPPSKPKIIASRDHDLSPSPERETEVAYVSPEGKGNSVPQNNSELKKTKIQKTSPKPQVTEIKDKNLDLEIKSSEKISCNKVSRNHEPDHTKASSLWVDKYKPSNLKQIIGQQGEKSNVNKLVKWLRNWWTHHSSKNNKIPRPSPWAKDDSGAFFKAALLSGPPGVGKTTTAHLVCQELGLDVVEFNASDTRSKKQLKEEVSDLLRSTSLSAFATGGGEVSRKHVLVMDEVDGMAGNEDRGGVQELIQLIKTSRVPVICMCNDRNHPKIRSLANYCFDLRFNKPRADQIRGAMMSICFKEGLKVKPETLMDVIVNTNQDIRLILNHLSVLAAENSLSMPSASKYVKIGPWDVLRKVFSEEEHKKMSIHDKCDLFFFDYNISPLFVQENYLMVQPHAEKCKTKKGKMEAFAKAASSLALGDIVDRTIRSANSWNLLPVQAVFSSYMPGEFLAGHVAGQITFPSWLGKNSRRGKHDRMCQEIQAHTRLKVSGSKEAINLDYSYALKEKVSRPLVENGSAGIDESIAVLREYSLLREDLDSLIEITSWPDSIDPFTKLDSKVKSAFTRTYNKNPVMTSFSIVGGVKKGRGGGADEDTEALAEGGMENQVESIEDEEEEDKDDITKDAMIVVKKKPNKKEKDELAGSSSGTRGGRGRGRGGSSSQGKRGKK